MPVNDFEKQVQRKMDELQLRPSGEVWEEVEKSIRKDKKRRRVIFWFFIFCAMLAGGSAWWLTSGSDKPVADHNSLQQTVTEKTTDNNNVNNNNTDKNTDLNNNNKDRSTATEKSTAPTTTTNETNTASTTIKPTDDISATEIKVSPGKRTVRIRPNTNKPIATETVTDQPQQNLVTNNNKPVDDQADLNIQTLDPSRATKPSLRADAKQDTAIAITKSNNDDKQVIAQDAIVANPPVVTTVPQDKVSDNNKITELVKDSTPITQPLAANTSTKKPGKKKNKWEFGVTAFVGNSNVKDRISFSDIFGGQKSLDANPSNGFPQGSPQSNFGGPVTPTSPPEPGSGFAWTVGGYAKRKLSARTGISAGLDFSALSTTQRTGVLLYNSAVIRNDFFLSAVSNYYSNGTVGSHVNRYYYLQVPILFHWQLNKGNKLPITWKNGLSFGALVGSDAVIYSAASNVFYRDKQLLNKSVLTYQSGVYVKLFNRKANPLSVGALVNYNFSSLEKVETERRNHLASFGLQLGWIFKK
jgi:hypothetical protein